MARANPLPILGNAAIEDIAQIGGGNYDGMTVTKGASCASTLCTDAVAEQSAHSSFI